LTNYPKIKK
jgi:hypothetical protein